MYKFGLILVLFGYHGADYLKTPKRTPRKTKKKKEKINKFCLEKY